MGAIAPLERLGFEGICLQGKECDFMIQSLIIANDSVTRWAKRYSGSCKDITFFLNTEPIPNTEIISSGLLQRLSSRNICRSVMGSKFNLSEGADDGLRIQRQGSTCCAGV